jgi:hypothetical protein
MTLALLPRLAWFCDKLLVNGNKNIALILYCNGPFCRRAGDRQSSWRPLGSPIWADQLGISNLARATLSRPSRGGQPGCASSCGGARDTRDVCRPPLTHRTYPTYLWNPGAIEAGSLSHRAALILNCISKGSGETHDMRRRSSNSNRSIMAATAAHSAANACSFRESPSLCHTSTSASQSASTSESSWYGFGVMRRLGEEQIARRLALPWVPDQDRHDMRVARNDREARHVEHSFDPRGLLLMSLAFPVSDDGLSAGLSEWSSQIHRSDSGGRSDRCDGPRDRSAVSGDVGSNCCGGKSPRRQLRRRSASGRAGSR